MLYMKFDWKHVQNSNMMLFLPLDYFKNDIWSATLINSAQPNWRQKNVAREKPHLMP